MIATVESTFFNDEYLSSIALCLLSEIESAPLGQKFKKIIPSMAFSCFALESKLNSCGKSVFQGGELKTFMNCQLQGKTDWILTRIGADIDNPHIISLRETIIEMISFRNSVTHSKPIDVQEERELIGLENINPRLLFTERSDKDFMKNYSFEKAKEFSDAVHSFKLVWLHYSAIFFDKNGIEPDYHIPRTKIIDQQ